MQKDKTNRLIYSASDLVNFTLCPSISLYDLQNLETPLEKADKPSRPGRHAYEVTDTKLSKKAAPKHIVQLCFYSELLEHFQGTLPDYVHLKLGDGRQESFYLQDYYAYYKIVRSRYERFLSEKPAHYPIPCSHCGYCSWQHLCTDRWTQDDHLSLVADIRNVQIKKLEETALKHLMSEHGTKEFQVDQLLRNHKLVDLYKVVKQGLRISESSYSLKKVENFYMEKRDAEVVSAVESVIFYEKWKLTRDPAILDSIRNYNEDDCRSTSLLHTWLLSIKPASAAYFFEPPAESVLDFLFSRKRLNVALSRARCLAILIANPRLLETACNTVEQMGLINTLCRAYYAGISDCRTPGADLQSLESYFQFAAQVTS